MTACFQLILNFLLKLCEKLNIYRENSCLSCFCDFTAKWHRERVPDLRPNTTTTQHQLNDWLCESSVFSSSVDCLMSYIHVEIWYTKMEIPHTRRKIDKKKQRQQYTSGRYNEKRRMCEMSECRTFSICMQRQLCYLDCSHYWYWNVGWIANLCGRCLVRNGICVCVLPLRSYTPLARISLCCCFRTPLMWGI